MKLTKTLSLMLIMALLATGAVHPVDALAVDETERLLPLRTHYKEGEAAQVVSDLGAATWQPGAQPASPAEGEDPEAGFARWTRALCGGPPDVTWRELFLVSRQNTKYKDVAVFSG